jgi:histidinol-phosphate aminotransferase
MQAIQMDTYSTEHGGADALGVAQFDFSTNANACGPCPHSLSVVQAAPATYYPDPAYTQVRAHLAQFHGVEPARVLLATSASEFIYRMTLWAVRQGLTEVFCPQHGYADYARAAAALGLRTASRSSTHSLAWHCEPSSPLGQSSRLLDTLLLSGAVVVLDRAYEPLRLQGAMLENTLQLNQVWQLWTPNKALGLTGVRAAYAIAPVDTESICKELSALCASWPVGSHGVAMLSTWVLPEVQQWILDSHLILRAWKARQIAMCTEMGWQCLASDTNFFCAKPMNVLSLNHLRTRGIKLRDCSSFGLHQHVRLSVQPPVAQDALHSALQDYQ